MRRSGRGKGTFGDCTFYLGWLHPRVFSRAMSLMIRFDKPSFSGVVTWLVFAMLF